MGSESVVEIHDRLPGFLTIAVSQKCIAHEDPIGEGFLTKLFLGITAKLHPTYWKGE